MKYRMRRADGVYRWIDGPGGAAARSERSDRRNGTRFPSISTTRCARRKRLRDRERELSQLVDMVSEPSLAADSGRRADLLQQAHDRFSSAWTSQMTDRPGHEPGWRPSSSRRPSRRCRAGLREALNHSFVTGERFSMKLSSAACGWRLPLDVEPARSRCGTRAGASSSGTASATTSTISCGPKRRCGTASGSCSSSSTPCRCRSGASRPAASRHTSTRRMMDYIGLKLDRFRCPGRIA